MNIVIAGGTGFLGRLLTERLRGRGDTVHVLTRVARKPGDVTWSPADTDREWRGLVAKADAVINLAGESVAQGRWTRSRKSRLVDSRLAATRALAAALRDERPGGVFVSASAVGYYGDRGGETLTEASDAGTGFLSELCARWEAEAARAEPSRRVVRLRTGLVLDPREGALAPLLLPFRLGLGGRLGGGAQYWPWIHRHDWVELAVFVIDRTDATGAINATAPAPVTNAVFARALARQLKRPALLPAPAPVLRLLLGEMADAMILGGQRAVPERALALGFRFRFETLEAALGDLLA